VPPPASITAKDLASLLLSTIVERMSVRDIELLADYSQRALPVVRQHQALPLGSSCWSGSKQDAEQARLLSEYVHFPFGHNSSG
jgi:hypothetical protein